ncbi:hypothetical protein BC939DRAFT_448583 [Gamsiella multidivaricata]|uniref:uncharacterized protein n=1 Tax=Gamsiella multidivaricata TaxID=101098 RepID=UPI00221F1F1F|nr:uncharacterized protein BC939DRAFT_448583 [Gamsiella multidivaricata]KAG0370276.1 hypothetical protein BGZ54_007066 [Gamsiella multidivaricata]KAI7825345.1 hypothetical protein BC939DRAFT_448583 [Gamsiella multidivaricata]
MGAEYIIFGRAIPTYKLAIATYALVSAPVIAMQMGKKEASGNAIKAASQDEEDFIREFVKAAEEDQPKNV